MHVGFSSLVVWLGSDGSFSLFTLLGFGLALGVRHAVEADHIAAVSTMASERSSILGASLVGGLWGLGHTFALLVAGAAVILLRFPVSGRVEAALDMAVALTLIALGANALRKLLRGGRIHLHAHRHGGYWHTHPHVHEAGHEADEHTHHGLRLDARPLVVGMLHGIAGGAALMLVILSSIRSPLVGFAYILVFGVGSIGGMMLLSALVGLPARLTARRFARADLAVRGAAALFSLACGVFMVYEIGLTVLFR